MQNEILIALMIVLCLTITGCELEKSNVPTTECATTSSIQITKATEAIEETAEASVAHTSSIETEPHKMAEITEPTSATTENQVPSITESTPVSETTPTETETPFDFRDIILGENETSIG